MAILPGGVSECGINRLCERREFSLHKISRHGSRKVSVSARCSEDEMGGKKGARKTGGLRYKKGASSWWLPLFGWSPDQKWAEEKQEQEDSKSAESVKNVQRSKDKKSDEVGEEDRIRTKRRSKSVPVRFTTEKAKILRKTLRTTSTFHDLMYHSAIASRLASPDTYLEEEEESGKGEA